MDRSALIVSKLGFISLCALALAAGCAEEADTSGSDGGTESGSGSGADSGTFSGGQGGAGAQPSTGGEGAGSYVCNETSSVANLENLPADLIIAVDNSNSMALESAQVKAQINTLVGSLTATNIDAHVVMISKGSNNTIFDVLETGVCAPAPLGSGNCPDDENLPGYRHVLQEVSSHDALQQIIATHDQWKDSLRPNASTTFLVVSDDESAMTAQDFDAALAGLTPAITDYRFNAIVASQDGPISCGICAIMGCQTCSNPCCDKNLQCLPISEEKGQTYMDLQSQTSGVYGDLCTQNFAPVFTDMATAVIEHTKIACSFDIPAPPSGDLIPSETNVGFFPNSAAQEQPILNVSSANDCTINGGWYFDNNTNPTEIFLCPSTCTLIEESTEGELHVQYGCTTETSPD